MTVATSTRSRELVALAGRVTGDLARAGQLARSMLAVRHLDEADQGRTNLNDDGCPLQLSLSATADCRYRLIADPAPHIIDPRARFARARETMTAVFSDGGAAELLPFCEAAIDELLVRPGVDPGSFRGGALWLGASLAANGCAVYVLGAGRNNAEWWDRTGRWLAAVLPNPADALRDVQRLRRHRFAWVSVEGTSVADARAKVYWRLGGELREDDPDVPLLGSDTLREFAHAMLDGRDAGAQSVVFSAGYRLAGGDAYDVKIDVCGHCAARDPAEWRELVKVRARVAGIDDAPLQTALAAPGMAVSFLGLGRTRDGEHRLNLYLNCQ